MSQLKFEDLPERFFCIALFVDAKKIFAVKSEKDFGGEAGQYEIRFNPAATEIINIKMVPYYTAINLQRMGGLSYDYHKDIAREQLADLMKQAYGRHKLRMADHMENLLVEPDLDMTAEERKEMTARISAIRTQYGGNTPEARLQILEGILADTENNSPSFLEAVRESVTQIKRNAGVKSGLG